MRKLFFSLAVLITAYTFAIAKKPQPPQAAEPAAQVVEVRDTEAIKTIFEGLPDSSVFEYDGQRYVIHYSDTKDLAFQIDAIIQEAKKDPPKSVADWVMLVVGLLASGRLLPVFLQAKKVGGRIILFFGKDLSPLNVLILSSAAIAVGGTFLWAKTFDTSFFFSAWAGVFSLSVVVYEKFIKKPKVVEPTPDAEPEPAP